METLFYVLLSGIVFVSKSVAGKSIKKAGEAVLDTLGGGILEEMLESVLERVFSAVGFHRQEKRQKQELFEKISILINQSKPDDFGSAIRFMEEHCPKNFDKTLLAPMRNGDYDDRKVIKKLVGELFDQLGEEQMNDLEYKSPEVLFAIIFETDGRIDPTKYPFLLGLLTILNDFFFLAKYHSMEKEDRDMLTLIGRITDDNTKKILELLRPHLELLEQQNRALAGAPNPVVPGAVSATPLSLSDRAAAMANRDPFFFVRLECPECGSADIVRTDDTATCSRCRTSFLVVQSAANRDDELRTALESAKGELLASNAALRAEVEAGKQDTAEKLDKLAAKMVSIEMFREMLDAQDAAGRERADAAVASVRAAVATATGDLKSALDDGVAKLSQGILDLNGKVDDISTKLSDIEASLGFLPRQIVDEIIKLITVNIPASASTGAAAPKMVPTVRRRCPVGGRERAFRLEDGYYRCPSCAFAIWHENANDPITKIPAELCFNAQGRLDLTETPTGEIEALRMGITPAVSQALLAPSMMTALRLRRAVYAASHLPLLLTFHGCLPTQGHIARLINVFGSFTDELRIVLFGVAPDAVAKLCEGTPWRISEDTVIYRKDD